MVTLAKANLPLQRVHPATGMVEDVVAATAVGDANVKSESDGPSLICNFLRRDAAATLFLLDDTIMSVD